MLSVMQLAGDFSSSTMSKSSLTAIGNVEFTPDEATLTVSDRYGSRSAQEMADRVKPLLGVATYPDASGFVANAFMELHKNRDDFEPEGEPGELIIVHTPPKQCPLLSFRGGSRSTYSATHVGQSHDEGVIAIGKTTNRLTTVALLTEAQSRFETGVLFLYLDSKDLRRFFGTSKVADLSERLLRAYDDHDSALECGTIESRRDDEPTIRYAATQDKFVWTSLVPYLIDPVEDEDASQLLIGLIGIVPGTFEAKGNPLRQGLLAAVAAAKKGQEVFLEDLGEGDHGVLTGFRQLRQLRYAGALNHSGYKGAARFAGIVG